ncbi:hypothetical protein RF11_03063 [Thelohanellus kitauei]|uniref:Uncharacterized protein n=1 Tax=Thelohanellus kitauei TaxID=669202 RepID=A0A0C2IWK9_THEKT|nr:hypothetical protein RF11_03063 [Thelohanellus kitauei]
MPAVSLLTDAAHKMKSTYFKVANCLKQKHQKPTVKTEKEAGDTEIRDEFYQKADELRLLHEMDHSCVRTMFDASEFEGDIIYALAENEKSLDGTTPVSNMKKVRSKNISIGCSITKIRVLYFEISHHPDKKDTIKDYIVSTPISPFLNLIDNMFNKWKNFDKRSYCMNEEQLMMSMNNGVRDITKDVCDGWHGNMTTFDYP